jgi:hypothetical protein
MTEPPGTDRSSVSVYLGHRLSRRAFLQSAAVVGLAAIGLEGAVSAGRRPLGPSSRIVAQQNLGDSITDIADALSYDVEAIFRFVTDRVRYEPYSGVLRGARGTLAARAGNSADQASLLAALLEASYIPYRFAVGRLDAATVDRLAVGSEDDAESFREAAFEALAGTLPGVPSSAPPALDPEARAIMDSAAASQEQIVGWARDQVDGTVSTIESALGAIGIALPVAFTDVPLREIDQHIWVQVLQGVDWVDLDPSLKTGQAGDVLTPASELLETLPDDLFHRVDFAVIGESVANDRLATADLLKLSTRADQLAGLPITFLNASPSGVELLGEVITPVGGSLSYAPTIVIGDEAFAGSPIRFGRGNALGEELFGGAEDILGGAGSGREATAEWLELTISSPDRDPVVVRRAIFDRVGPAARAAAEFDPGAVAPAEQITIDEGAVADILPALATTWLAVNVGPPERDSPILHQAEEDTGAQAVYAQGQHFVRELSDLAIGLPLGTRSFLDSPNVSAYTVAPRQAPDGEQMVEFVLDIWHRSHGVVPVAGTNVGAPHATVAGILDHVAERVLGGDALRGPADAAAVSAVSVGAVFEAAQRDGVSLRALSSAEEVASLGYPADAAAILQESLGNGWLAVVPEHPVTLGGEERAGWWLIDAATGRAVDQLDDGRGAQGIEYQATLTPGQLARETAARKLARDCLAGTAAVFGLMIATLCVVGASASDREGLAIACAAGVGAGAFPAVRTLAICTSAALP